MSYDNESALDLKISDVIILFLSPEACAYKWSVWHQNPLTKKWDQLWVHRIPLWTEKYKNEPKSSRWKSKARIIAGSGVVLMPWMNCNAGSSVWAFCITTNRLSAATSPCTLLSCCFSFCLSLETWFSLRGSWPGPAASITPPNVEETFAIVSFGPCFWHSFFNISWELGHVGKNGLCSFEFPWLITVGMKDGGILYTNKHRWCGLWEALSEVKMHLMCAVITLTYLIESKLCRLKSLEYNEDGARKQHLSPDY